MKFYIAGLDTSRLGTGDHFSKTKLIINHLDLINKDAEAMGKDTIIFVVLQEYAITEMAIPNSDKKECLNQLQMAINNYSNMILIPGSFAAFDTFNDTEVDKKLAKQMVDNYFQNFANLERSKDAFF